VLLTKEAQGYYGDYQAATLGRLARALASGFVYQGEAAPFWGNRKRGEPSGALPPSSFVNFLQNHDQVGNRPFGDRLEAIAPRQGIEAALAITLLSPCVPMLFMGEEWGSKARFPFFCDFKGGLAEAVRKGRREEYKWAYAKYGDEVPDPLMSTTFKSAKLDWGKRDSPEGAKRLALVRELLACRAREIAPRLKGATFGSADARDSGLLTADWQMSDGATLRLMANISANEIDGAPAQPGRAIWGSDPGNRLPPWSVFWRIGA
jgi:maltooligosyltrehalose trehalohydrolase